MRMWKIATWIVALVLLPTADFAGEFPDEGTLHLKGLYISRDGMDLSGTVPSFGDINYRVTTPSGVVVDLLENEQGNIHRLHGVANDAARELQEMEYLVRLYAVITCEPARGAARKLIARRFDGAASTLDRHIKTVGGALPSIKTPAAAAIGVRLRDHLREAALLLSLAGENGK